MTNSRAFTKLEFSYLREVTILEVIQAYSISAKDTLELEASQVCILQKDISINGNHHLHKMSQIAKDFFFLRKRNTPDSPFLFPTFSGKQLRYGKFIEHMNKLLQEAKGDGAWSNGELSQSQVRSLIALRFNYQKPRYQRIIACALMGTLATRPSEIAQLEKRDINLSAKTIKLQKTKSQELQTVPIFPALIPVLEKYLAHLPNSTTPLFSHTNGTKWSRKDVYQTMKEFGEHCGIDGVTAQRMRPTVVLELHRNGATLPEIQCLTRHKHLSTLMDHYIAPQKDDARHALLHLHPFPTDQSSQPSEKELANY